jgi:hypothetical protein
MLESSLCDGGSDACRILKRHFPLYYLLTGIDFGIQSNPVFPGPSALSGRCGRWPNLTSIKALYARNALRAFSALPVP